MQILKDKELSLVSSMETTLILTETGLQVKETLLLVQWFSTFGSRSPWNGVTSVWDQHSDLWIGLQLNQENQQPQLAFSNTSILIPAQSIFYITGTLQF